MAEFIMKNLVEQAGLADRFHIESAATGTEEIGNSVYPPARRKLAEASSSSWRRSPAEKRYTLSQN